MKRGAVKGWVLSLTLVTLGACPGGDDKEPIQLGLLIPLTGAADEIGASFERVAEAAIAEINAKGGVDGHPLELIVADTETDEDVAPVELQTLIDSGVIGVVGPATSGAVTNCYPVARDIQVPIISPSSTDPLLASVSDGGFMFRNTPDDDLQGVAMAYYLTEVADPAVTSAVLVYEDTPYGRGLAGAFEIAFESNGGAVTARITFDQNLPDDAAANALITELVNTSPTLAVMIALEGDALRIVQRWDAGGQLPNMDWFLTDGARNPGFLASLPASMEGMRGTAPTFPTGGDAYQVFKDAYEERNNDAVGDLVFAPNVWDGVHLMAAALVAQMHDSSFDGTLGGNLLRQKLTEVSNVPGSTLHAGQWRDLTSALKAGSDIDYDGASGPNDFDADGETIGPYEVWRIADDQMGGYTFVQDLFLDARDIQDLAN